MRRIITLGKSCLICLLFCVIAYATEGDRFQDNIAMVGGGTLVTNVINLNTTGVKLTGSTDGDITLLGMSAGYDEDFNLNLDDTENEWTFSSTTAVTVANFGTIDLKSDHLKIYGASPTIWIQDTDASDVAISRTMQGLDLSTGNTSMNNYLNGIKFMSTDSNFTTENPKFLAGIIPIAGQLYAADDDSAMGIDFFTSPLNAGVTNVPIKRMKLDYDGDLNLYMDATAASALIIDGTTTDYTDTALASAIIDIAREYNSTLHRDRTGIELEMQFDHAAAEAGIQDYLQGFDILMDDNSVNVHPNDWAYWFYERGGNIAIDNDAHYDTGSTGYYILSQTGLLLDVDVRPTFTDTGGTTPATSLNTYGLKIDVDDLPTLTSGGLSRQTNGIYVDVTANAAGSSSARGLYISSVSGGDVNYGIYDVSGADWVLDQDSQKIYFGENVDSYIEFDGNSLNLVSDAVTATDDINLNELTVDQDGGLVSPSTLQATTAKLTNLTDSYIPYHAADATGLANSPLSTDNSTYIKVSLFSDTAGQGLKIGDYGNIRTPATGNNAIILDYYTGAAWAAGLAIDTSGNTIAKNIYPVTDNTYYVGKNDDDTPFAYKGIILKDQGNGKYYRIELINGLIVATDLTD